MSRNYIGKTCPYCKTPLTEGDTVVVCSVCDMPHHLSCWQDNRGCTTFGCTGSIKEIIEAKTERTTAPVAPAAPAPAAAPVRPAPSQATSAPKQVTQSEKPIETLYDAGELVFLSDLPVAMENTAIIIDRTKDKLFARCVFRSLTDKPVSAMLVEIACQDVWGNPLGEPVQFQYLDLKTKMDTKFGQTSPIELPDKTTRKIKVSVEKVLFADGTVATGGDVAFTMPAPVHLRERLGSDALAAEYARETSPKAQFVLETANGYWRCACGALNTEAEENCHNCGCTMEQLTAALDPEKLNANLVKREEAKRAAEEKAKAEQEERIRQAEEQARQEKNRKEHKARVEAILEQRKKRRKKTGIAIGVSLVIAIVLICVWVFIGIPYSQYQEACDALADERYDEAIAGFISLGDYKDSEEKILEAKYRKADAYRRDKKYKEAYQLFTELGNYKESKDEVLVTIILWETEALGSSSGTEAVAFSMNVRLNSSHYEKFYSTILNYLYVHTNADYWYSYENGTTASNNVLTMLQMLPSSYEDTSTLVKLFELLTEDSCGYEELFRDNKALIRQCWGLDFVQDMAEQDDAIAFFLEGDWSTYGGDYYIKFYENSHGGTSSTYNLPWVSEPYGTKYYDIRSLTYIYTNGNSEELAKVYRFKIVDYDTIEVFCYKNNRTYTLYR